MKEQNQDRCRKVGKALPAGALKEIADLLKVNYSFAYRVMNGNFKRFTPKHSKVLKRAEKWLTINGIKLIEQ